MKRFLATLFTVFLAHFGFAQSVSFDCQAPLSAANGQQFQVQFILSNAEGSNFSPPKFEGLDILVGPSISTGQNVSIINGVRKDESFESYIYFVRAASSTGKATISVASINANGKRYATRPVTIDISAGSGSSGGVSGGAGGSGNGSGQAAQKAGTAVGANDVIVRMEVSKKSAYKGEALTAQLKLYTRTNVQIVPDKFPAFNGFWAQELDTPEDLTGTRATINGKTYNSKVIRQWLLYPQKTGVLEIEQSSYTAHMQIMTSLDDDNSILGLFHGSGMQVAQNVERKLVSPPIKVDIKPLPVKDMPNSFSLAVGKFSLKSEISATSMTANSAGSIKITVSGQGDFPLIDAPKVTLPEGIEQYETKMSENVTNSLSGTSGSKTWEFPFVARSQGDFDIAPIEISYFDPSSGTYKTLKSEPYRIKVSRDPNAGAGVVVTQFSGNEDIKPIFTAMPKMYRKGGLWLYSGGFFGIAAVIAAAFVVLLWFLRRQISLAADVVGRKYRRANRVAVAKLKTVKRMMDKGDRANFFEQMLRAMWGFAGDKFAVPPSQLTKENIAEQFATRGYEQNVSDKFLSIVEQCEFARYAPKTSVDMGDIYNQAIELFSEL